jgi:hypothetical protein
MKYEIEGIVFCPSGGRRHGGYNNISSEAEAVEMNR